MTGKAIVRSFMSSVPGRWYLSKEPRDQRILQILALAFLLTLVWLGVWKPIQDWKLVEQNRLGNAQGTVDWMRTNEMRAREVSQARQGEGASGRALLPLVTRSAESAGIALTRVQPDAEGSVSIILQDQSFNEVVRWLHQIEQNNGVTIERGAFDATTASGRINAQIRLR
ncbi:MAG: type II secretion system protein GspM [Pseudomonadales bacterium]